MEWEIVTGSILRKKPIKVPLRVSTPIPRSLSIVTGFSMDDDIKLEYGEKTGSIALRFVIAPIIVACS